MTTNRSLPRTETIASGESPNAASMAATPLVFKSLALIWDIALPPPDNQLIVRLIILLIVRLSKRYPAKKGQRALRPKEGDSSISGRGGPHQHTAGVPGLCAVLHSCHRSPGKQHHRSRLAGTGAP
ncbi:hypothetical protein NMYAN_110061 [Nitrosomonas nitrosa]|uniref:Uncharacterized protein n=1 Tax=Nitrosomonas nitrosa TaxID=52442 RepID=A0A8H8YZ83_9PROT|nr:hypothetical protein NMYAN_110061 [Nitrosomonas nitrosa]